MPSEKRKFGDICEAIVAKRLSLKSYKILERNYSKKWGEIDLIVLNKETIHFVEAKGSVYNQGSSHRPEDNVHMWKTRRLWRAIQTWLMEHPDYEDYEWQIDIAAVFLDFEARKAKIRWTRNIIIN